MTQPFEATYLLNSGSNMAVQQIDGPGSFSVQVNTICQIVTQTVEVMANANCSDHHVYIPNVFSPNGDQVNGDFIRAWRRGTERSPGVEP